MKNTKAMVRNLALAALFAALVTVATALAQIPIPGGMGYIHLGDAMVYLAAVILPFPYAAVAVAVGAGLADFLSGFAVYVLPTALIKALLTLAFTSKKERILTPRNLFAPLIGAVITVVGYGVAEGFLYGWTAAIVQGFLYNAIQALGSAAAFFILGLLLDKANLKNRLRRGL
jgi:uncharacterized repeat protein (TIGR04002 family)